MKVYISVDLEGIGGISHPHPTDPSDARYPMAVELMVGEANAAIEGALAAGATGILVNDSHWSMYNLLPEALLGAFGLADDAVVGSWLAAQLVTETEEFLAWERSTGRGSGHGAGRDAVPGEVVDDARGDSASPRA